MLAILNGQDIPPKLNHTFVALIPKKANLMLMLEFCPISLCNFIYKPVTKVFSNGFKPPLANIVSELQSAFTLGRLITDNILVAYEIFHSMYNDMKVGGAMAIKLDMLKAYDKIEWLCL
uniref:Uncharacterized protein n=1 Tax=Opuntia streptacantha TaxID=393608 RepID=A0A7C9A9X3_OPUST